jgi:NAD-dependent dihydropyrimidine dehydrogenase PreA subunit
MSGLFIDVAIDDSIRGDAELAQKLEDACPVDIYANEDGQVKVVDENLDECVLCELCVKAAPPGAVKVLKLYDGTALESQGAPS